MLEEMFHMTRGLAKDVSEHVLEMQKGKEDMRNKLGDRIKHDSDVCTIPVFPTTAGTDGSYCAERMLAIDFLAVAAVCVEGLTPPKLTEPIWERPHHFVKVVNIPHDENSMVLSKALMFSMETQLAAFAPHNVVFLDGSLVTLTITFNQAFNKSSPQELIDYLNQGDTTQYPDSRIKFGPLKKTLDSYIDILESPRSDRVTVAVPKYSIKNEVATFLNKERYDDKGLLSVLLKPGEYIEPFQFEKHQGKFLTASMPADVKPEVEKIENLLSEFYVTYYKPKEYFPAIRLEM